MKPEILFEEKQCFATKVVRNFFIITSCFFFINLVTRFLLTVKAKEDWLAAAFLIGFLLCAILSIFFSNCLITHITLQGIDVRFPPFLPSTQQFLWNDIQELRIIKYNSIMRYGGWGIRFGPYGKAYTISGNIGLQIVFTDNSKLLIGTREPEKLAEVLQQLGKIS